MKVIEGGRSSIRNKMIAKVHIAKNELDLSEFEYRRILKNATGKTSCKYMHDNELARVLDIFEQMGFVGKKRMSFEQAEYETKRRMITKLSAQARKILGDNWRRRVDGFCKSKLGVSSLEFCDIYQLRSVWAFLRRAKGEQNEAEQTL